MHELLVAGPPDYFAQRPTSLFSNVLVLPNFAAGDRVKFDAEGKISISPDSLSLRGRALEGAVFVNAQLKKADFTGARLQDADLREADLRGAKFLCYSSGEAEECFAQRVASRDRAPPQGASPFGARLQGALLDFAQLQGVVLDDAQLQGASLDGAQLQGAALDGAQLQGALLDNAQLQGASLNDAQLQGASLHHVFVWRTNAPTGDQTMGASIVQLESEAKYQGLGCTESARVCSWTEAAFGKLKSLIEDSSRAGPQRDQALRQISTLERPPYVADEASAKAWKNPADVSSPPDKMLKALIDVSCWGNGGPYAIRGLIEQLDDGFDRFQAPALAEIAVAFLDEVKCGGARGLSGPNKAKLRRIQDLASKPSAP